MDFSKLRPTWTTMLTTLAVFSSLFFIAMFINTLAVTENSFNFSMVSMPLALFDLFTGQGNATTVAALILAVAYFTITYIVYCLLREKGTLTSLLGVVIAVAAVTFIATMSISIWNEFSGLGCSEHAQCTVINECNERGDDFAGNRNRYVDLQVQLAGTLMGCSYVPACIQGQCTLLDEKSSTLDICGSLPTTESKIGCLRKIALRNVTRQSCDDFNRSLHEIIPTDDLKQSEGDVRTCFKWAGPSKEEFAQKLLQDIGTEGEVVDIYSTSREVRDYGFDALSVPPLSFEYVILNPNRTNMCIVQYARCWSEEELGFCKDDQNVGGAEKIVDLVHITPFFETTEEFIWQNATITMDGVPAGKYHVDIWVATKEKPCDEYAFYGYTDPKTGAERAFLQPSWRRYGWLPLRNVSIK